MLFMVLSSVMCCQGVLFFFFFFNDTATTEIYTLSLHDALPICVVEPMMNGVGGDLLVLYWEAKTGKLYALNASGDRKSTRLNSSHGYISYAVFCLKKKKKQKKTRRGRTTPDSKVDCCLRHTPPR